MRKRLLGIITILILLAGILTYIVIQNNDIQTQDIIILYTNDVHCAVDEGVGYAGLASLKKQYEADGAEVILVDCGDAIQGAPIGTLSKGKYIIDIMNKVGYDVATIGNHEFDYGSERLLELVESAEFPYVSCNFRYIENGATVFEPYTMLNVDNMNIAFIGITTPHTITSSAPAYFQDDNGKFLYTFEQESSGAALYKSVQATIDAAKADGADYIIALSHLGITENLDPWMSTQIIENTTGIDVLLDGHSHSVVPCERVKDKDGNWVLISQTGTKFESVGMLLIQKDGSMSTGLISEQEEKDNETVEFISQIQSEFENELQKVVAKTSVELTTLNPETGERLVRNGETNLGDFCADAYRIITGADVAFLNGGGIRDNLEKGDITYEDILKVHPFGNAICVVEATGQEILDALELGVQKYPLEEGSFPQVSGITFELHSSIPSSVKVSEDGLFQSVTGEYRVKNVMVGKEKLELDKTYTLASHDYYIKNGGSGFIMFQDNVLVQDSVMLDNQILIEYITEYLDGKIGKEYEDPRGQGRIIIK